PWLTNIPGVRLCLLLSAWPVGCTWTGVLLVSKHVPVCHAARRRTGPFFFRARREPASVGCYSPLLARRARRGVGRIEGRRGAAEGRGRPGVDPYLSRAGLRRDRSVGADAGDVQARAGDAALGRRATGRLAAAREDVPR